jgi:nucleotide-binding universal stress UspA family protein
MTTTFPTADRAAVPAGSGPATYRTVLVALDGSPLAERALPFARAIARGARARLVLVRAVPLSPAAPGPGSAGAAQRARARGEAAAYLERIAPLVTGHGAVEAAVLEGEPAAAILAHGRARGADLLVLATHGRSGLGRWLYGSVADAVLRQAATPVLLVPATSGAAWPDDRPGRVVVALDGSHEALAALSPARALAAALGARLLLLKVVEPPSGALYRGPIREQLFHPGVALDGARRYLQGVAGTLLSGVEAVEVRAAVGPAAAAIAAVAREAHAGAVAMATHGRGGLARAALGSVATETLHRATVPLLLVRAGVSHVSPQST